MLRYVTLRYVTIRYATLRYVTLRYGTLRYDTLRYVMVRYFVTYILHYITFYYITLYYITLHYIILYYIALHYILLHYITRTPNTWGIGWGGEGYRVHYITLYVHPIPGVLGGVGRGIGDTQFSFKKNDEKKKFSNFTPKIYLGIFFG